MLFHTITIKDKDYKARLTARALVELEKKMGTNPVNVFIKMGQSEGYMPETSDLILILHASLQAMEHGITLDKTYELFDEMMDEGKSIVDLVNLIVEIFKVSGMYPDNEDTGKNQHK
mgnify:CR=1 FL=1